MGKEKYMLLSTYELVDFIIFGDQKGLIKNMIIELNFECRVRILFIEQRGKGCV